ncbi:hypothetical protein G3578_07510 [Brevibacillus sp. SYP-B805]|uniref:hypothetical protein n=1 Tax=Brevibacillus sp. SYP-B805 TaxID=1578199 RepID=UPI0013EB378D|nr:hypothetical protein [Brevibacillus sp. SYP-B805]NGQ95032.1 hypothetical protein [Brevibacillus sp. SYP-B805]
MRTEALNGLKVGDYVRHRKSSGNNLWYRQLTRGEITGISKSGKSVYVRWVDEKGNIIHWANYSCDVLVKI